MRRIIPLIFTLFFLTGCSQGDPTVKTSPNTLPTTVTVTVAGKSIANQGAIEVTIEQIYKTNIDNQIKATREYLDKKVRVKGVVERIAHEDNKNFIMINEMGKNGINNQDMHATCFILQEPEIEKAAELKVGDQVTVEGYVKKFQAYVNISTYEYGITIEDTVIKKVD
ncbi:tRNA_anti-like protein [anaerobic digester metagenome]